MLKEVQTHMGSVVSANKIELRLHYMPLMKRLLVDPLISQGTVSKSTNNHQNQPILQVTHQFILRTV